MFMDVGEPEPPPIAEGAYWVFMLVAILLATPGVVRAFALVVQQELAAPVVLMLDQYEALLVAPLSVLHEVGRQYLPSPWREWMSGPWDSWLVLSFAGAAFTAGWVAAGLRRAAGFIGGFLLALLLTVVLGATLLGLAFLLVAYLFISQGALIIPFPERANDRAIVFPLLVPLALVGALLAVNALV